MLARGLLRFGMQSTIIALFASEGCRQATLLVRRGDGQFALELIDARVAAAARIAAHYANSPLADAPIR